MTPVTFALAFNMPTMLILLALALLIFGARLPSLGKNLGKSIVSFKKGLKEANEASDDEDDADDEIEETPRKKPKQLAAKTTETTTRREKQKVVAGDDEDEDEA